MPMIRLMLYMQYACGTCGNDLRPTNACNQSGPDALQVALKLHLHHDHGISHFKRTSNAIAKKHCLSVMHGRMAPHLVAGRLGLTLCRLTHGIHGHCTRPSHWPPLTSNSRMTSSGTRASSGRGCWEVEACDALSSPPLAVACASTAGRVLGLGRVTGGAGCTLREKETALATARRVWCILRDVRLWEVVLALVVSIVGCRTHECERSDFRSSCHTESILVRSGESRCGAQIHAG